MSYTPFLPTLWNTVSTKFTEFSPISVGAYNIYDGALRKFTAACYEYDTSSTYVVDEYCYYTSAGTTNYYKANQAITTPEAFTPAHWDVKTTAEYMTDTSNSVTISSQFGAGVSVDYAPVAEAYDISTSYGAGKMVINDGKLYRANEDTTAGAFDPAKWTQINVAGKMIAFNDQTNNNIAPIYSTAGTYDTGAIVVYANPASQIYKLYRAKEDGVTGTWDSTKWDEIAVTDQLFRFKTNQVAAKISPATVYSVGDYATWQDELYKVTTAIPAYDASAGTYAVGDYVEQDGKFYCCNTAITTPEIFDDTKWDIKTNAEMIAACFTQVTIMSQVGSTTDAYLKETAGAQVFDASKAYSVYDRVIHDGNYYMAIAAHAAGEAWNSSKWYQLNLVMEIQNNRNQLINQFVSQEMWTAGTFYNVDDTVYRYSDTPFDTADIYICKTAHTAGTTFDATEKANWTKLGVYGSTISELIKPTVIYKDVNDYTAAASNVGQLFQDTKRKDVISNNGYLTYQCRHNMDAGTYEFGTYENTTHPKFEIEKLMDQLGQALGITVTYTEPMISSGTITDWQYAVSAVPNYYPEYKTAAGTTYSVGDRVMHLGKYYMAKESVSSGVWDDTKWLEVNPEEERAKDATAELTALGLTRAVTYNSTTGAFEYTYTMNP